MNSKSGCSGEVFWNNFSFSCPGKGFEDLEENIQKMLDQNGFHKNLIAKKFHEKRENFMVNINSFFFISKAHWDCVSSS